MRSHIFAACVLGLIFLNWPAAAQGPVSSPEPAGSRSAPIPGAAAARIHPARATLARLPLAFEPNCGQAAPASRFIARSGRLRVGLRPDAWQIAAGARGITMRLLGASRKAAMHPEAPLTGRVSYFNGPNPAKWLRGLPTYGRILTRNAYTGIDVAHYGNRGRLEHDFIVAPGAKAAQIAIRYEGAEAVSILPNGDLQIATRDGTLRQLRPVAYQELDRKRQPVAARYAVDGRTVRFKIGRYDHQRPLVIDPVLSYSSYLGGVGYDAANAVAVDASGAAYVTGQAGSTGFPFTPGAFQQPGAAQGGFVAKINPQGTGLVYCVNFGDGLGNGVAVDAQGNAYVGGTCSGLNFPVTPGAFTTAQWGYEVFVMKIDPTGSDLLYSSRFGGSFDDFGNGIAIDSAGNAVLVGTTSYRAPGPGDFPSVNAVQTYGGGVFDMFVTKLNANGTGLVFSTYLGGGSILNNADDYGTGVAIDPNDNIYVSGSTFSPDFPVTAGAFDTNSNGMDGTVTKFTPQGAIVYSTFIGGTGREEQFGIAVDAAGSAYVTGYTNTANFPTTSGAFQRSLSGVQDAYLAKLSPSGGSLVYGTYFGGPNLAERGWSVAVDTSGSAWVVGDINESSTSVYDLPVLDAIQPGPGGGLSDGFVARFGPTGNLLFSTYLGGSLWDQGHGVAVDSAGSAYVVGSTSSDNFLVTAGSFQPANAGGIGNHDDAFVLKIGVGATQPVASLASYTITPSSVPAGSNALGTITLTAPAPDFGANITLLTNSPVVNIPATITVPGGQTSVSFNIGTQVPSSTTTATLGARYGGITLNATLTVTVSASAPTLSALTLNPTSVVGGSASQGTVTLTAAAPAGGAVVALSSSSPGVATVPATVTVPAGATSAAFQVSTATVTASTTATITAVYGGISKSAVLTINPQQSADTVAIQRAEYTTRKQQLKVNATSTSSSATLRVYVTSTNALIGTLAYRGGGKYDGQFSWPSNPQNITVRSSLSGSASRDVTPK